MHGCGKEKLNPEIMKYCILFEYSYTALKIKRRNSDTIMKTIMIVGLCGFTQYVNS